MDVISGYKRRSGAAQDVLGLPSNHVTTSTIGAVVFVTHAIFVDVDTGRPVIISPKFTAGRFPHSELWAFFRRLVRRGGANEEIRSAFP